MICFTDRIDSKEILLKNIEILRSELIQIGFNEGLASTKTIEISQRLDLLIVKYQTIKTN